jgi:hypothetical protein
MSGVLDPSPTERGSTELNGIGGVAGMTVLRTACA